MLTLSVPGGDTGLSRLVVDNLLRGVSLRVVSEIDRFVGRAGLWDVVGPCGRKCETY